jgi:undecaprenyl-diphosphatase
VLAGLAVGFAVAVACSRVLLDVHWLSDVIAGLALGWGWFALCAAAFGGWMLRLGAPVEQAQADASGSRGPAQPVGS